MNNNIKYILDTLKQGQNVFLTGGAGVGKSYTIDKIIKSEKFKTVVLASTALAAINIGGDTVHRFFKLRLAKNLGELRNTKSEINALNKTLNDIELIIIDEVSMISAELFEMIIYRLRDFPNIKLLIVGDFYQLEPVNADGNYAFKSPAWIKSNFKTIELCTQYRMEDKEFYDNLQKVRQGRINQDCVDFFKRFILLDDIKSYDDYTIICGTNDEAKNINISKLKELSSDELSFSMKINYKESFKKTYENDFNSWVKGLPIEQDFKFKIGAKVIFTHNSDIYFNGMQGEIIDYKDDEIKVRVNQNRYIYSIKPKDFLYFNDPEIAAAYRANPTEVNENPDAIVSAYPLKLAYAITIHKSQGMSIDKLICKCDRIFAQGQLYVALSRSSNPDNFKISFSLGERAFNNMFYQKAKANADVQNFYDTCDKECL